MTPEATSEPDPGDRPSDADLRARLTAAKAAADMADEHAAGLEARARTARDKARSLRNHHDGLLLELQGQLTIDSEIEQESAPMRRDDPDARPT
jgi:hypothetical protein